MKRLFPLSLLLGILAFVLTGCGGSPSNSTPNAKFGGGTAANSGSPSVAPSGGQPSPPAPQNSPLPTPPSNATVFDQIQNTTDNWNSCSACAMGTNTTSNFWAAPNQSTPSMTGSSRQFFVGGPEWTNALWWKTYFDHFDTTHIVWDFYVYWDPTSMANIWTAEFDFWQAAGGKEFMIGSQCNFGEGFWDLFDSKANKWVQSNVACNRMAPNEWHHIQWYLERSDDHYRFATLVVDGKAYDINQVFDPNLINWQNSMGVQWQLDQSSTGVDLHEWIDNVRLTVW
jgi:hypothetical protein